MQLQKNLQLRILTYILGTLLIVFVLIGLYIGSSKKKFALEKAYEYTHLTASQGASNLKNTFTEHTSYINASSSVLSEVLQKNSDEIIKISETQLAKLLKANNNISSGWILVSSSIMSNEYTPTGSWSVFEMKNDEGSVKFNQLSGADAMQLHERLGAASETTVSQLVNRGNERLVDIYAPLLIGSRKVGFIGLSLSMSAINQAINNIDIIDGATIAALTNTGIYAAHSNSAHQGSQYAEAFIKENKEFKVEENLSKEVSFSYETKIGKQSYFKYYVPVKFLKASPAWTVEVSIPLSSILKTTNKSIILAALISFIGLLLISFIVFIISNSILKPIKQVTNSLNLLSEGNLKNIAKAKIKTNDELSEMSNSLNKVVEGLRKTEGFALEIRDGNLNNTYTTLSTDDQLGKALLEMRDSLKESKAEDEKRKIEDEQAAWATNGIARFGEILRQDNDNLKKLGYNIMSNLVKYLNVNQGALFVLNEDDDKDAFFELITTIAFDRDKYMDKEIRIGEGLIGRCAFEKKTVFLTDVPKDYHNIKSGLGDAQPGCILIVPCILNDEVFGIIEIASFTPLKPHEIEFVEKLGESIGSTLSSARINLKTAALLNASKNQSEELAAQEEELRQNLEEMEATQEDLKRQMNQNEEMRAEMSKQAALLDSLLNTVPDYIYFKDKESKFITVSKSMIHLFGANAVSEIVGKSDFDFHTSENAKLYFEDEQRIMQTKEGLTDQLQKEVMADGTPIWNSVTKLPLLTIEGECIGTFGISKNVTDIKNLEIEAKKQTTLLDALLDSLPDYIYFKDEESRFLRISKSMVHLFGTNNIDDIIGKSDFDFHTPENAQKYYNDEKQIMETGKGITNQLQNEQLADGSQIWNSVTKLPLITEEGECIGTFGISKDVTDLKNLEIESTKQKTELTGVIEAIKKSALTIEYNKKGVVTEANQGILDLLKLEKKNYLGTHNKDEIADMSDAEHKAFWDRLLSGEAQSIKNTIKVGNKKFSLFEAYSPVFDENKKIIKVLRLAFDIS